MGGWEMIGIVLQLDSRVGNLYNRSIAARFTSLWLSGDHQYKIGGNLRKGK